MKRRRPGHPHPGPGQAPGRRGPDVPAPGEGREGGAPRRGARDAITKESRAASVPEVGATPSPALPRKGGEGRAASRREVDLPRDSRPSPSAPKAAADLVLLGEFGRAHGLKGEVRLKSFTGDPQAIATYGPMTIGPGRTVTLRSVRPAPGGAPDLLIAKVEGVDTREAAEALNRVELSLPRHRLPPPDGEDEFLLTDLIGVSVETPAGEPLGTVVAVPNYGGGDLLEVAPAGGGTTALVPFTKAFVPLVEVAARRVVVDVAGDLFASPDAKPPEEPA